MLDDLDWDKLDKRIWTTKDGRDIPLAEIDDKHLANLIVWCDKRILHFENKFITIRRESLLDAIDAFGGDLEKYNAFTEDDGAEWAMEEEANLIMETIKRYFGTWARLFSEEQARRSSAQMGAV